MKLHDLFPDAPYVNFEVEEISVYESEGENRIKAYFNGASGEYKDYYDWFPLETIYVAAESLQ